MADAPILVKAGKITVKKAFDKAYMKSLPKDMVTVVEKAIKADSKFVGRAKDRKQPGYQIDVAIDNLTKETKGNKAVIGCKVSVLVNRIPGPRMFASLSAGFQAQTRDSEKNVSAAVEDNVAAVVEKMIKGKASMAIKADHASRNKKAA